jgi:hypothetical protein
VGVVGLERQLLPRCPRPEAEGPVPHRLTTEGSLSKLPRVDALQQVPRHRSPPERLQRLRVGRDEGEADRPRIQNLGRLHHRQIRRLQERGGRRVLREAEGEEHVLRRDRLPVVPGDVVPEVEGDAVIVQVPALGQRRDRGEVLVELDEGGEEHEVDDLERHQGGARHRIEGLEVARDGDDAGSSRFRVAHLDRPIHPVSGATGEQGRQPEPQNRPPCARQSHRFLRGNRQCAADPSVAAGSGSASSMLWPVLRRPGSARGRVTRERSKGRRGPDRGGRHRPGGAPRADGNAYLRRTHPGSA